MATHGEKSPLVEGACTRSREKATAGKFTVHSFRLSRGSGPSLLSTVAYASSSMLSSGLFIAPSLVLRYTESGSVAALVWLVAGIIAMTGSLAMCELGCQMPVSGGFLVYIENIYGRVMHFAVFSITIFIIRPLLVTVMATTFGIYMQAAFSSPSACAMDFDVKMFGLVLVGVVALFNAKGISVAFLLQRAIFVCQALLISFVVVTGAVKFATLDANGIVSARASFVMPKLNVDYLGSCGIALYGALYCSDGWGSMFSLVGEMRNPKRGMIIVSVVSIVIVIVSYAGVTLVTLSCLSIKAVSSSNAPLSMFLQCAVHEYLGYVMPLFVGLACLGGINAVFITVAMYTMSAAKSGAIPKAFGMVNASYRSPMASIALLTALACVFTLAPAAALQRLVNAVNFFQWVIYSLCFVGVLILRFKYPTSDRFFQLWLPIPIALSVMGVAILAALVVKRPYELAVFAIAALVPIPVYYAKQRQSRCLVKPYEALHGVVVKLFNLTEP